MSRAEFQNDRFKLVFGVDHTPMGTFFQVYDLDQEEPCFEYDALFGPRTCGQVPNKLESLVKKYIEQWPATKRTNLTEEHIVQLAKLLNLHSPKLERKIRELWD